MLVVGEAEGVVDAVVDGVGVADLEGLGDELLEGDGDTNGKNEKS